MSEARHKIAEQVASDGDITSTSRPRGIRKSLRWKLQAWQAAILLTVLVVFGILVSYLQRRSHFQQVDAELQHMVYLVETGFRPVDRGRWQRGNPRREPASDPQQVSDTDQDPPEQDAPAVTEPDSVDAEDESTSTPTRTGRRFWRQPGDRWIPPRFELREEVLELFGPDDHGGFYFVLWSSDGKVLSSSENAEDVPFPNLERKDDSTEIELFRQRGDFREVIHATAFGSNVLVGRSVAHDFAMVQEFTMLLTLAGGVVLAVGLCGGWWLASRAIQPIDAISAAAESISADNLSERIDLQENDSELGRLGAVLNSTFARLEEAFEQQVRFTADASHELRTPLAVLLSKTEVTLSRKRPLEEYREALETCHRAGLRMKALIEELLTLARIDSGELQLRCDRFDLASTAREQTELVRPLAEVKGIEIDCESSPTEVDADSQRVAQVLVNLLTNALHHTSEGGKVSVCVRQENGSAIVSVTDTGTGIPDDDLPRIFDRFYRADKNRSRADGGSGLGLSICRTLIEAHGGSISVQSERGTGSTFEFRLPRELPA